MLVSMTGFGQGEASSRNARVTVEIRSVNHRYFDLSIKLPKGLAHREHDVKDLVKRSFSRGRIAISVLAETDHPEYDVRLNTPLVEQYVKQLRRLATKHSIRGELDIKTLAMLPEVFHLQEHDRSDEELWPLLVKSLKQASAACNKMRHDEGKALEADLRLRSATIGRVIKRVEALAPNVIARHGDALKERVGRIMAGTEPDRDRLITEIALLTDRLDFTEEVTRLKSHMAQIKACMDGGGAVSKKLTYLLQEVHREATTIGSKAADAEVVELTISLKDETERLREQVQNLE
jgi:uncharacterized protein (TIGR00255 family)